jgi:hypothetical protein
MRYYFFTIKNNAIDSIQKEPTGLPVEYKSYKKSNQQEEMYYREINGAVTNIICQAINQSSAKEAVEAFLLSL